MKRPALRMSCAGLMSALLASLSVTSALADPPLPVIPAGTFLVTTYSAVSDGVINNINGVVTATGGTDNTTAIKAAITAATAAGGGTVEFPAATGAYMSQAFAIGSNINLQIDAGATLAAQPYGTYSGVGNFITINTNSTNVEISGGGVIEGNGASGWWNLSSRPRLIQVSHTDKLLITGVTLHNSPMFHIAFSATNDVTINDVIIYATNGSPNTDAIDPAGSHYLIENCTRDCGDGTTAAISEGDDNIAVKAQSGDLNNAVPNDIVVTNCHFGFGHGLSVGGQTNKGLYNMVVSNCTFKFTTSGLRLKADPTEGGLVQNVSYSGLTMHDVQYPIVFYSYYNVTSPTSLGNPAGKGTPALAATLNATLPNALPSATTSFWQNITLSNVSIDSLCGPSVIWGLPLAPNGANPTGLISNVTLNNVQYASTSVFEIDDATNVQFTGTTSIPTITTYNALALTSQPQSQSVLAGSPVTFQVTVAGTSGVTSLAPTYLWSLNSTALTDGTQADGSVVAGSATASLTVSNAQAADAGSYTCAVSNTLDSHIGAKGDTAGLLPNSIPVTATSAAAILTVDPASVSQPASLTAGAGQTAVFSVTATGATALSYQWNFNTAPITGATDAYLVLSNVQSAAAGSYTCTVTDTAGSVTSNPAALTFSSSTDFGRIINCSIRDNAGTGDSQLIAGFVLGGAGTDGSAKTVLLRGDGPTLAGYGVTGALADPALNVFQPSVSTTAPLYTNTGWNNDATVASVSAQVGAFALTAGSLDSALVESLTPGSYTANITGGTGDTGIALAEVYDATTSFTATTPRLVNVSGRAQISSGAASLIAGFVIGGSTEKTVLVRGLGPVLANYGVTGALADPQLAVHQLNPDGSDAGVIAANTAWAGDPALSAIFTSVGASPLADPASADCALLVSLPPGVYTANVTSASNATGVALVEVYEVP